MNYTTSATILIITYGALRGLKIKDLYEPPVHNGDAYINEYIPG